ncbi:MAG: tryptophan--tRNA ligase [Candidatus Bathyarchaeota archaeon]|nr:tryptophan--tRNA ligase [Candidatus Bathyarchaeota archaeon]
MTDQEKQEMVVTPWDVSGNIDYDKLIEQFGVQRMTQSIVDRIAKHAGYKHLQLRRGVYLSHRDTDWWLSEYEKGNKVGLYTGRGPSGHVHLGHLLPWFFCKYLQDAFDAELYFQMTDDEKFLQRDDLTLEQAIEFTYDNALDIIACGFNPEKTHIFSDSDHIQHLYKLGLKVAKRTTFSTVRAVFGFNNSDNIGAIWHPALQMMVCFLQSEREGENIPCLIPAAIDQDPYWRITRDIAEKMGYYKPAQIHAKFLPGLDEGGKMSSSQPDSAIFTTDSPKKAAQKVMRAFTGGRDTVEEQKKLGGRPDICNVYAYYYFMFEDDDQKLVDREAICKSGELMCGTCKKQLAERVKAFLTDFQEKREKARKVLDDFLLKPVVK